MTKKLKIITIIGTRPEIIRLSRIISLLDKYFCHLLVHTGQNYDYELNELFISELGIRKPDHFMNINNSSLGQAVGGVMLATERIFLKEKPEAVLILGDTNSSLSAIIAKRMKIPIYHMEAGNRSFDLNVPEEINRKIVDHISDFNLVYTEHARRHLLSEGLPHRRIYLTGSPLPEVLNFYKDKIAQSLILQKLKLEEKKYFIVSIHREENVDNRNNLKAILSTLTRIAEIYSLPVIVSTHPRTKARINDLGETKLPALIKFMKPFGYFDYISLQKKSLCVISDSGTISEEASILKFPAITIRNSMERPEALDCGEIVMSGLESNHVTDSIEIALKLFDSSSNHFSPDEYQILNTSERVLKLIMSTVKLSNVWSGITPKNMSKS
jgi:UDP-N-acetyl-L-fucosamine synthase